MTIKLLTGAKIYTLDPAQPTATGLIIQDGEILKLLHDQDNVDHLTPDERYRLGGKTILPGLVDAHIHLKEYALSLQKVDCETDTKQACLDRVAARVREAQPGEWILGHGWDQNRWDEGYGTRQALDDIAPENPIFLSAKSLHAAWVNSAALQRSGIPLDMPDPTGGRFSRDSQNKLTGVLFEGAIPLVEDHIPEPGIDKVSQAIREAQESLWQMGLTGVHDFDRRLSFSALQQLERAGHLQLRVRTHINIDDLQAAIQVGLRSGFGSPLLQVGGIKAFADGALGPQTAAMIAPYQQKENDRGVLLMDVEELTEKGIQAARHGLSLAVHAIGDRANREVLDAFQAIRAFERNHNLHPLRHRIEHVQLLAPGDMSRLRELGIIASMQPIHAVSDMETAVRFWGDRVQFAYPWRALLRRQTTLAFGSDAPVESPDPFLGIHAAVTRRKRNGEPGPEGWIPEQRLSLADAIRAYTQGPAYAAGQEDHLGQLTPGNWADLIVLDQDPLQVDPQELHTLHPTATMVAGNWVWRAGE